MNDIVAEERNIELRSEKVRSIVGKIPPAVDRYGIAVIGLVLTAMLLVSMLIPYKETVSFGVRFDPAQSKMEGVATMEAKQAGLLKEGMPVSIVVMGESVEGEVVVVSEKRVNGKYEVRIRTSDNDEITIGDELEARAVVTEKSWFEVLTGRRRTIIGKKKGSS